MDEENTWTVAEPTDDAERFARSYGEPLAQVLNLDTWSSGQDLGQLMARVEREVGEAIKSEDRVRQHIRASILPRLPILPDAPPGAGVHRANLTDIEAIHRHLLFPGKVQACDGTTVTHDTLPLTITQIGVSLVAYNGDTGSWSQRLFRRDLRAQPEDVEQELLALFENRQRRKSVGKEDNDQLSMMAQRAVMTFAERNVLVHKADQPWRIGHGNPTPTELLWGAGTLYRVLLPATRQLISELLAHKKFIFVPSAPNDRVMLTIGNALNPLEYAIVDYMTDYLTNIVDKGTYNKEEQRKMREFAREAGPQIVRGVYRAARHAPATMFYAHRDYFEEAAHIALADSLLQEHRGFPMLIDLADRSCQMNFGSGDFSSVVRLAYTNNGEPYRYLSERETRK